MPQARSQQMRGANLFFRIVVLLTPMMRYQIAAARVGRNASIQSVKCRNISVRSTKNQMVRSHISVIISLMLRDIKTRSGATYFGFLFGTIVPLGHIFVLLIVYAALGRRAPIGTDVTLYLTTAILPFVVWSYTHQKISLALSQNYSLTLFPIVKLHDIIIARIMVEILNSTMIVLITAVILISYFGDIFIFDTTGFCFALILACALGMSTGFVFGFISLMYPIVAIISMLLIPIYWMTSGTFFIPAALPPGLLYIVSFFPLSHIVDFARTKFYSAYLSDYPSLSYVACIIVINFNIGIIFLKFRHALLDGK